MLTLIGKESGKENKTRYDYSIKFFKEFKKAVRGLNLSRSASDDPLMGKGGFGFRLVLAIRQELAWSAPRLQAGATRRNTDGGWSEVVK